jgi:hypothetical protein
VNSGWKIEVASGTTAGNLSAGESNAINMVPLTSDEVDLAYALFSMGQVAPVRAGAQLYASGHHYLSDPASSARCRAIETETLVGVGEAAMNIWRANTPMLRNVVWHAGPHVVKTEILEAMAEDPDMPARLDKTGYGSMSVGLPAQEDLFNRAGSFRAVYDQVRQTAIAHNHTISLDDLFATVAALQELPRNAALPANRPDLPNLPSAPWPPGCDTRAKALKIFLEPALDAAEPVAAWMFGFYKEICARAGVRANSLEGSLLRSYSLKRAVANYIGEANRAQEMYAARSRYMRAQADEGFLETYTGSA